MKCRLAVLFLLLACVAPAPRAGKKEVTLPLAQHALYRDYFRGLQVPAVDHLIDDGHRHRFPGLDPELVWRGALRVMVQQGILAHVSSEARIIVCISPVPEARGRLADTKPRTFLRSGIPQVLHLRPAPSGGTEIVLGWLPDLYRRADHPDFFAVAMTQEVQEALTEEFIESIEVEATAAMRWQKVLVNRSRASEGRR